MKKWISLLVVLLLPAGCTPINCIPTTVSTIPTEEYNDDNRKVFTIDPTKDSPFNGGKV